MENVFGLVWQWIFFHAHNILFRHRKLIFMIISFVRKYNELQPVEKSIDQRIVHTYKFVYLLYEMNKLLTLHYIMKHSWMKQNTYCNFMKLITDYRVLFAIGFFFSCIGLFSTKKKDIDFSFDQQIDFALIAGG